MTPRSFRAFSDGVLESRLFARAELTYDPSKSDRLYDRLAADPDTRIPAKGYSVQKISFSVEVDAKGNLVQIRDARELHGKEALAHPGASARQSSPLIWDPSVLFVGHAAYMLGFKAKDEKPERTRQCWKNSVTATFWTKLKINHPEFSAVCRFLERWGPKDATKHSVLADATTGFGVFKVTDNQRYVHQVPEIRRWWGNSKPRQAIKRRKGSGSSRASHGPIARLT